MRNPKNSWHLSDSLYTYDDNYIIGEADLDLMMRLAKGGPVHAKYRRMIMATCDITAPLYWWKEYDTYKVATVANSTSTMHKIHSKKSEKIRKKENWEMLMKHRNILLEVLRHCRKIRII